MKYMGSKRTMLKNGLGQLICKEAASAGRIVDLFCGAGAVAWYAAENTSKQVIAVDLQQYATVLAESIIGRNKAINPNLFQSIWIDKARKARRRSKYWSAAFTLSSANRCTRKLVDQARNLCKKPSAIGPIWNAYGGHYFSPAQAISFDFLLRYLPPDKPQRTVTLAAVIIAASRCAAAPGHTAQPFQPTRTAGKYLWSAWQLDPLEESKRALEIICPKHAKIAGSAYMGDAVSFATRLKPNDLVIIDPPYSGVHYSRFYHVLETIAQGKNISVFGAGRYPPLQERPQSKFSLKAQSKEALTKLLSAVATAGSKVIFTFPHGQCSNGLSGQDILDEADGLFDVQEKIICGKFSTLGGNNERRESRAASKELLLLLIPKKRNQT